MNQDSACGPNIHVLIAGRASDKINILQVDLNSLGIGEIHTFQLNSKEFGDVTSINRYESLFSFSFGAW